MPAEGKRVVSRRENGRAGDALLWRARQPAAESCARARLDQVQGVRIVKLLSGDGHILLADCATPAVDNVGVVKVWTTEQIGANGAGQICFKVTAPTGRLDLEVPGVYEIRGDGQQAGFGHQLTAVVDTASDPPTTVVCNPSGSTQVGIGTDPSAEPTTLSQLRVPS